VSAGKKHPAAEARNTLCNAKTQPNRKCRNEFMPQVFDRSSNALARGALVLGGVAILTLALMLNSLQRSPWVTREGQRAEQPVPFSHKHHVEGLGLQCQYCHTTVEKSGYAGIPPTKTCMNCHAQIWTNANLLEPVRESWVTGKSIPWIKVHDLPDYVYFNHSVHVNKGIGCESCHGRVDKMPIMYEEHSLQMEWCLDCHRNPAKNLRPTSEIYNMAWKEPSSESPVWCGANGMMGVPTAQAVSCTTKDPVGSTISYTKYESQKDLGLYLTAAYHIRPPSDLTSCETCHR